MIDIIIPVYNSRKTLPFTLLSICRQTIKDKVRILLVDDCSSDNYDDIIEKFSSELRIKIVHLDKNVGPGLARQYGMEHSRSKYICFIDSDDLLNTVDSLEILYKEIEKGYDSVMSYVYHEDQARMFQPLGDLHGKIYRRKFIMDNEIKFNNTRYHEDNAFNNLVIVHGANISTLDCITYDYVDNQESTTNLEANKYFERLEIYIDNMDYVIKVAEKHNCSEELLTDFVYRKYGYLNFTLKRYPIEKKNEIRRWLNKYDFTKYLKQLDMQHISEIASLI